MKNKELLLNQIKIYGKKGLLPQNLPIELLTAMKGEIENNEGELILMTVLFLSKEKIKIDTVNETELLDKFEMYIILVLLQIKINKGLVKINVDCQTTLSNIFDEKRKITYVT